MSREQLSERTPLFHEHPIHQGQIHTSGSIQIPEDAGARDGDVALGRTQASNPTPKTDAYNIAMLSIGFLLIFTAYNSLQNYVTSLLPGDLGNISLSVLYCSVCIFVFIAPSVASVLGERLTMVLGAVCYIAYMASLIKVLHDVCIVKEG